MEKCHKLTLLFGADFVKLYETKFIRTISYNAFIFDIKNILQ